MHCVVNNSEVSASVTPKVALQRRKQACVHGHLGRLRDSKM